MTSALAFSNKPPPLLEQTTLPQTCPRLVHHLQPGLCRPWPYRMHPPPTRIHHPHPSQTPHILRIHTAPRHGHNGNPPLPPPHTQALLQAADSIQPTTVWSQAQQANTITFTPTETTTPSDFRLSPKPSCSTTLLAPPYPNFPQSVPTDFELTPEETTHGPSGGGHPYSYSAISHPPFPQWPTIQATHQPTIFNTPYLKA